MIHWKLTEQQADQVLVALQHRPYLEVAGLIGVLMQQAQEQQKAQQAQLQAQQVQAQRQLDKPFDAAESNHIGEAIGNAQSAQINGLDRHA
jgi:hypothetical protein